MVLSPGLFLYSNSLRLCGGEDEGFDEIMVSIPSSRNRARLHRSLALNWFESPTIQKNTQPQMWLGVFWQRMRDSNPRKRSQSPVCYRYTNPLCSVCHCQHFVTEQQSFDHFTLRNELSTATRCGGDNRTRTCDLMRVKHRRACRPDPQRSNQPITVGTRRFFGFHDCADCVVIHNQTS